MFLSRIAISFFIVLFPITSLFAEPATNIVMNQPTDNQVLLNTAKPDKLTNEIKYLLKNSTPLLTKKQVNETIDKLAKVLNKNFKDKDPIILCVMTGALIPLGQLLPKLDFPLELDYVHVSRNKSDEKSFKWKATPTKDLKDRNVIVFDDILDKGNTMAEIVKYCKKKGAKKVSTVAFLNKKSKRSSTGLKNADYVGISVEDSFVFGFGMDYKGYWRNVSGIYTADNAQNLFIN